MYLLIYMMSQYGIYIIGCSGICQLKFTSTRISNMALLQTKRVDY